MYILKNNQILCILRFIAHILVEFYLKICMILEFFPIHWTNTVFI